MPYDEVIDVGEFLPRQQASAYFELDLSEPARVIYADNCSNWVRVFSSAPNKEGKQLFQLICDSSALGPGAIAVGNVEIVTDTLRKNYWLMAKVLEQNPADEPYDIYLEGKDGRRIYFESGFLIGEKKLPGCGDEKVAILLRENGGTWAMFSPWKTPVSARLNGVHLNFGQRALLNEGAIISAGSIDLVVQRKKRFCAYSASQNMLDFGVLGVGLYQQKIQLKGSKYGKATIVPTMSCLTVSPSANDFQPETTIEVTVGMQAEDTYLGPGRYRERGAILIRDQDETLSIDVTFEITAQTIIPRITSALNFGVVSENWNIARATTTIINDGSEKWSVSAVADQAWITVDTPNFEVFPGNSVQLSIRPNSAIDNLSRPGNYDAIVTLLGNDVKLSVPVSLRLSNPNSLLDIEPLNIDLGDITSWASLPSGILRVSNTQNLPVMIRSASGLDWLMIEPRRAVCQPGQTLCFVVKLNEDKAFAGLRVKKYSVVDAIKLFAGSEEFFVGIDLDVKKPVGQFKKSAYSGVPLAFDVSPAVVDLGCISNWDNHLPIKEFVLRHNQPNSVPVALELTVPWLGVRPESVSCPPEGSIITVEMLGKNYSQGLRARQYNVSDAIIVKGDNIAKKIPVKVDLSGMTS